MRYFRTTIVKSEMKLRYMGNCSIYRSIEKDKKFPSVEYETSASVWQTVKKTNKPDGPKSTPSSSFLDMQRTLLLNVYHFSVPKIPQRIRIRLGNHVFPNWKQKIHFSGKSHMPKSNFQLKKQPVLKPKSAVKAGGHPLTK